MSKPVQIFLCHASEDKPKVVEVYRFLQQQGFRPWLDKEDLLPGQRWDQEIPKALQASDFVLIFFSQKSTTKRGYVQKEFKLALEVLDEIPEGQIFVIPVRLDECEIPERFQLLHYCDLFDAGGPDKVVRALRAGLKGSRRAQTTRRVEQKVALIIGNGAYKEAPLRNPVNDAADTAAVLQKLDFRVQLLRDANRRTIEEEVREFGRKLLRSRVGLFYFAGHGLQIHGRNYIIPIGADIQKEEDVEFESVDVRRILGEMKHAQNQLNVIILDACRNNPFARSFRSPTRGLAQVAASNETLIVYAASPGDVVEDGGGKNSPYTEALLQVLPIPGLDILDIFRRTAILVEEKTAGRQRPWIASDVTQRFYFIAGETKEPVSPPVAMPSAEPESSIVDEELKQKVQAEKSQRAEEEQRRKAEEEQRRKAEEEQRRKAEEEQRRKAEEEQRRKAEEEQRRKAEEEQRRKAEEEQRRKAEEEQRRKAEEEQTRKAEEELRRKVEDEQRRKGEEERRRKAEEEQRRNAEEEQRRKAEEEQRRKAEEEQRRKAEEKQIRKAEEEQRRTPIAKEPPAKPEPAQEKHTPVVTKEPSPEPKPTTTKPKPSSPAVRSSFVQAPEKQKKLFSFGNRKWLVALAAVVLIIVAWVVTNQISPEKPLAILTPRQAIDSSGVTQPIAEHSATPRMRLRSVAETRLSEQNVRAILKARDFFCKTLVWTEGYSHPYGKGLENDYVLQKNGQVVYDRATGLMWEQAGSPESMTYEEAQAYVARRGSEKFAGYTDWRLPTLEEAMSLLEPKEKIYGLYIDPMFDKTQHWIWTADKPSVGRAWVVFFRGGYCYHYGVHLTGSVRAVRSGQS